MCQGQLILHIFIFHGLVCFSSVYTENRPLNLPVIGIGESSPSSAYDYYYYPPNPASNTNLTFQNSTVYVVPAALGRLVIECNATYPVMWNLADSDINSEMFPWIRVRSTRFVSDVFDPSTFLYSTQIVLGTPGSNHKLTGNYSCQATAKREIQSNVFVFWKGTGTQSLVHSKEKLTVYIKNGQVTLPCGVSSPDSSTPELRKEPTRGVVYERLGLNKSINYRTTSGFVFKNLPYPLGKFTCLFGDGLQDYVSITVKELNATDVALSKLKNNGTFTFDKEKNEAYCCSNSKRAPNIILLPCEHAVTCTFREHVLQPYHYIFTRGKKSGNCTTKSLLYFHAGLMRCIGDGIDEYKEIIAPIQAFYDPWRAYHDTNTTTYLQWEEIEPQEMLTVSIGTQQPQFRRIIRNNPATTVYSKQEVNALCSTSQYYFSDGVKWAIRWKNKTLTPSVDQQTDSTPGYHFMQHVNSITVTADISMESLICFAPVWNSSLWVSKTFFLYINESTSPSFKTPQVEEFTWYTNETQTISCEAKGSPDPYIVWKKGSQILTPQTHNYNISTTLTPITNQTNYVKSELTVLRVTYSTHGDITCVASNYGGSSEKVFQITVLERKSWRTATVLIIAGIIICILFAIIAIFLRRMKLDKKAINHLTSVHFKDPELRENAVATDVNNTAYDNGKINMSNQLLN